MQPRKIVDLFAGPGGLDVAAKKLGLATVGIEWDDDACTTREAARLATIPGDVRKFGPSNFQDADVLAGGPPCQTFTIAGDGAGRKAFDDVLAFAKRIVTREPRDQIDRDLAGMEDERTGLVLEPLRWALEAVDNGKPYKAIILEQVPAVLPVWKEYAEVLESEGYATDHGILRTETYGVPQTRKRAILVARKGVEEVKLPEATHRTYRKGVDRSDGDSRLTPWVAMGDVLKRPYSFIVVSNYGTGGDPKARGRRGSWEPSATVTGKISRNRVVSEGKDRARFTHSEAGCLQTFPRDYPWSGRDIGQQIGNAVPPRLAMHVLCAAFGWGLPSNTQLRSLETWGKSDRDMAESHVNEEVVAV